MSDPVLLDVTRIAVSRWRGRTPTGLDRVAQAYARHYAGRARAVVQLAGHPIVLDYAASRRLFDALDASDSAFRRQLATLLPGGRRGAARDDEVYLNVGHSGFDRAGHWRALARVGLRRVYMVHDLIPITHPQLTTPHKTARHRGRVCAALARADGIVTNSQATADALARFAREQAIAPPPILAAPIAADMPPMPEEPAPFATPYFLCLGTIEPRKNHALLLRVWARLIDSMGEDTPHLVIAGSRGSGARQILSALREDRRLQRFVTVRSGLSDTEVATMLAGARALLFPTLAEGFGLPVAEALMAGVPVIASDLPALRETGQGVPLLLDAADEHAWAEAVASHCRGDADRTRQLAAMPGFRPTNWADHFAALEEWLAKLPARRLDWDAADGARRTRMGEPHRDREWQF